MTVLPQPVLDIELPFAQHLARGKVREIYELNGDLLLVTTDRISAFDVVMNEGVPGKGIVLTSLSRFWFSLTRDIVDNHMLSTEVETWSDVPVEHRDVLAGRTMRCRAAEVLPVEWVVRGYLTGSGFKDYQRTGAVCGIELPAGFEHASRIDPPILTPTTKADSGHDMPMTYAEVESAVGVELAARGRDTALALYRRGHDYAVKKGFVIADTKFEFGIRDGRLLLIDECLTPDSSRFWPADEVHPGAHPESFDKQVVRDYLDGLDWDKSPPPPQLPDEVLGAAASQYGKIHETLTGQKAY
ncbi:MAG: phosphoribosylaminoimidazolesuccinocarboxamide synthase [Planctomycetota bacterium]|nr:phosphoribosylaminoimidazolesuccinocarboxamide synthase [Planctomycetota bacterium]